jgi:hypothetical protein
MKTAFIETPDDIKWLRQTCLRGVQLPTKYHGFKFAVIEGNEDGPDVVDLYVSDCPNFDDDYYRIAFIYDGLIYAECLEYNGKTNKPYSGFSETR